jgi:peptide/nickel transport system permease protein
MGSMLVDGVTQKDFPVMQGVTAVFVGIVILVNLAVDLSYAALDPRIRR